MKRLFALLLALVMVLSLCACAADDDMIEIPEKEERTSLREKRKEREKEEKEDWEEAPAVEAPAETVAPAVEAPAAEMPAEAAESGEGEVLVVADNAQCYLAITGVAESSFWGYGLNVVAENRSEDTTYSVYVDTAAVNSLECYAMFGMELKPGERMEDAVEFDTEELEEWGVTSFTDIAINFQVYDSEDWSAGNIVDKTVHYYPEGKRNAEVFDREMEDGDFLLCDNAYMTAVATGYWSDDYYAYIIGIYLENKTDAELMFALDNAYVNEIECDPFYATTVGAGNRKFTEIGWYQEDFDEAGILVLSADDVAKVELEISAYNNDDWSMDYYLEDSFVLEPA